MDPKTLRPFQVIVLAVFAVLAVIGLLVFANFSGTGGGREKIGEVVVWGAVPKAAMDAVIADLSSSDDRFGDVRYEEKSATTLSEDLADALASGVGPDVVLLPHELLNTEESKLALIPYSSLAERTYVDSYLSLFELFLREEGSYGIPVMVDPLVLYYNRAILSTENIVSPPSSREAVAGLATAVTKRSPDGALGRSAIALGEYSNVHNARAIISLLLLQSGTAVTERTTQGMRAVFADDDASSFGATPAQSAINFYTQFADPAKTVYSWNRSLPDSRQAFVAGDLALYLGFSSELPYLSAANPNLEFDMAPVPIPGTAARRIGYGVGYAYVIPKGAPNGAGGVATAFMLAEESRVKLLAESLAMVPAHRTALTAPGNDRYRSVYYPEALNAKGWISPAPAQTDRIFSTMINDMISGRAETDKALSSAAASVTEVLR